MRRLLVVGAGPAGIEMALEAVHSGKFDVTVVETGSQVAANVRSWGHVRFFSPWELNMSALGAKTLGKVPDPAAYPTGLEFVEAYLEPLAAHLEASGHCKILLSTSVVSIGRGHLLKGDLGSSLRAAQRFRVLLSESSGGEKVVEADVVVDASGTYGNGNHLGMGGLPAVGERGCADRIERLIPDVLAQPAKYLGKQTLIVGAGYSAVTTLSKLVELARMHPEVTVNVVWATRRPPGPVYDRIPNDSLPQRDVLAALGNQLAVNPTSAGCPENFLFKHVGHVQLTALQPSEADPARTTVHFERLPAPEAPAGAPQEDELFQMDVDNVVSNTGYRPDSLIFQELQVHQCYASEGPMKLAAALLAASGAGSADCLAQVSPGPQTLMNPEPNFFIIGMKSYGRGSKFLLKIGQEQVTSIAELLSLSGSNSSD
uniref:FAD/NAD(P)-binding domain-containing protein n=1 Tax=Rhizochromulina marina TaxID=1034831 RepID=A0A7S2STI1_9STRA